MAERWAENQREIERKRWRGREWDYCCRHHFVYWGVFILSSSLRFASFARIHMQTYRLKRTQFRSPAQFAFYRSLAHHVCVCASCVCQSTSNFSTEKRCLYATQFKSIVSVFLPFLGGIPLFKPCIEKQIGILYAFDSRILQSHRFCILKCFIFPLSLRCVLFSQQC